MQDTGEKCEEAEEEKENDEKKALLSCRHQDYLAASLTLFGNCPKSKVDEAFQLSINTHIPECHILLSSTRNLRHSHSR